MVGSVVDALAGAKFTLERDGLCIIPDVLSPAQVTSAREAALTHLSQSGKPYNGGCVQQDVLNHAESLHWLLTDTPLSDAVHGLVGDDARYVHHADLLHNTYTGWHKDSTGFDEAGQPMDFWSQQGEKSYRVYKFGFYLQDHAVDKTALKYILGSHLDPDFYGVKKRLSHFLAHTHLHCGPRDLVVFDQRITHNGVSPWLPCKLAHRVIKSPALKQQLWTQERALRQIQDRVFIQIAFGQDSVFSRSHARAMARRQAEINGQSHYELSGPLASALNSIDLPACELTENTPVQQASDLPRAA